MFSGSEFHNKAALYHLVNTEIKVSYFLHKANDPEKDPLQFPVSLRFKIILCYPFLPSGCVWPACNLKIVSIIFLIKNTWRRLSPRIGNCVGDLGDAWIFIYVCIHANTLHVVHST